MQVILALVAIALAIALVVWAGVAMVVSAPVWGAAVVAGLLAYGILLHRTLAQVRRSALSAGLVSLKIQDGVLIAVVDDTAVARHTAPDSVVVLAVITAGITASVATALWAREAARLARKLGEISMPVGGAAGTLLAISVLVIGVVLFQFAPSGKVRAAVSEEAEGVAERLTNQLSLGVGLLNQLRQNAAVATEIAVAYDTEWNDVLRERLSALGDRLLADDRIIAATYGATNRLALRDAERLGGELTIQCSFWKSYFDESFHHAVARSPGQLYALRDKTDAHWRATKDGLSALAAELDRGRELRA